MAAKTPEPDAEPLVATGGNEPDPVEGEITLSRGGDVVLTKRVTDGQISPKDDDERALLLGAIPGAKLV